MRVLLDTNVLLRASQVGHAQHEMARRAVGWLAQQKHRLCVVPQVLVEFWVVATRPHGENGLGLATDDASRRLNEIRQGSTLLEDLPGATDKWQELVLLHEVKGKQAHDARIVASMLLHGVRDILTFNSADYRRFTGVRALGPAQVGA